MFIQKPNSLLCINFQTAEYDIQFGMYHASKFSKFIHQNAGTEDESINCPLQGEEKFIEIMPLRLVENTAQTAIRITYTAKNSGFFKLVFSNEHSWVRPKTIKYRYCVLVPEKEIVNEEESNV